jgi:conjugative relaxase-like TrwC/TraI family protein
MKGGMHFYRGSGHGAARYFDEGHRGAEAYYTEQARVAVEIDTWRAGERVGTTLLAESGDLIKWVEGIDPATGEVKGIIRAGGKERQPLRFVEVVVNNPKSLSIVASQNPAVSAVYDRVLARQADEIAKYLSSVAVTRIGPRYAQREVGDLTVETARVLHLTSREGDPHRHIHLMLNTRVQTPDGSWHGLHSAALRQHIRAINERGSRILVTDAELSAVLTAEGYTLGRDGEIDQARGAVELMSKRATQLAANRERIEAAWRAEHPDREPSQRVKNGWDQQAWAEGRPTKPGELETPEQLSERVRGELAVAGFDFTPGARQRAEVERAAPSVGQVDRELVAERAIAVLSSQKSAWSRADLTAEVEAAVSRTGVVGDAQAVTELVEDVEARALAGCLSVLDPEVQTPTAMSRYLTSEAVVNADMRLNLGLAGLAGDNGERDAEGARLADRSGLGAGQSEAVAAVTGSKTLEVVVGPAGTGKTTMLAVAKDRLDATGREMLVVAPTRKAALVAGAEVGTDGASLSKLLYDNGWRWDELGRFTRLSPGDVDPVAGWFYNGPPPGSALSSRSVIVVDEAGLITVDQANALIDLVAESGSALRLIGDPRQLGAVGRGGVMEAAARWSADPVTLDEVHRFLRVGVDEAGLPVTEPDAAYAALSLRLREDPHPEQVIDELIERGAVVVHESRAEAIAAIAKQAAANAANERALAVTVATNEDADALNQETRRLRVQARAVDDGQVASGMNGVRIGQGDRIVTRRNDTARDVANRESWVVEAVTEDGTVHARAAAGERRVVLEAGYLREAAQLGYATTDYGNQGVTADRSVTWVGDATSAGGLYVGATRGRYENVVHVVAEDPEDGRQQLISAANRDRADRGLDVARVRAEADAVPAARPEPAPRRDPEPRHEPPAPEPERPADRARQAVLAQIDRARAARERRLMPEVPAELADWRSAAELDAAAASIDAQLARGLRSLHERPVMPDDVREAEDAADRQRAADARAEAEWHRAEAARIAARRAELVEQATADYFAARDDARTIAAGPGRFNRKAAQVADAEWRRDDLAQRWSDRQLPGAQWTDGSVRYNAERAVDRMLDPDVKLHTTEAKTAEQEAQGFERRIITRASDNEHAARMNETIARQRNTLVAGAERQHADVEHEREVRAERIEDMAPEEVAKLDTARDALLIEQARAVERARVQEPAHHIPPPGPHIEPRGPSLGR